MTFFEIINDCLSELNYKQASSFAGLTNADDLKVMDEVNNVNREISLAEDWYFRQQKTSFTITANTTEFTNPIVGKIALIMVGSTEYIYSSNFDDFYSGTASGTSYGLFSEKILFASCPTERTATIYYYTNYPAKTAAGTLKSSMTLTDDVSIIPEQFRRDVLVYGACLRTRAMTKHVKYGSWLASYLNAIKALRSGCLRTKSEQAYISTDNRPRKIDSAYSFGDLYG